MACNASQNATDFQTTKAKNVAEENLVYIYQNRGCPDFSETYKTYGFKIECGTDVFDRLVQQKNLEVVKKIEKHYGKGWFDENFQRFITKQ
ncbi:MAG: hypothetical protein GW827_00735 [Flavobacteriales bacterium]|nr:hypothetical protein [Flavobacteriales bacterium]PIV93618.1 MAG: hypothetical protein COW44_08660 [Flavobacteriaceae bacterium CG17_big_fil_post_rev_8_21_14_2_50_33_15]PIY13036.1 MAG: hypothetical protein COZ17_01755 [Flavobacteriaceae bacterium CG_4_10_14_3_um_filter_33_47]PJB16697.1 MAG: hypothetical protein CO117_14435 [Flavobacteriaceae bacterium CG_4_9_14_3_um_filter_33_16]